jgi:hypothetical protein
MKEDLASVLADLRRENVDAWYRKARTKEDYDKKLKREAQTLHLSWRARDTDPFLGAGKRMWIKLWDRVDGLLPELVLLAEVSPSEYRGFCLAVHERVLELIDWDFSDCRDEAMLEAERRLRAAQDAIVALSELQQHTLDILMKTLGYDAFSAMTGKVQSIYPDEGLDLSTYDWNRAIPNMLIAIAKFTGSAPYRPGDPRKPGPKKKERVGVALREFTRDLWSIAQAHGGDFSVGSKPDRRGSGTHAVGSLVDALRLLEPVLPSGFVSNMPSFSTLNRCRPKSTTPLKGD